MRRKLARRMAALVSLAAVSIFAAETDNWTYRYLRLEDSAPKLNAVFNDYLERIAEETNRRLAAGGSDPARSTDTEVELTFVKTYVDLVMKKFGERLLPIFGTCIEKNDCPDWPRFERIPLEGRESVYGEARYNRVAIAFVSPSFQLCGVRLGTDKLTHLFSHGFYYYNASRLKGSRLKGEESVRRTALDDELGMMGAHSTEVVSPADAEATTAGFRLATDYFQGDDPVFARNTETGLLRKRRAVDLCRYVSSSLDEAINRSRFTARRAKVERLEAAIAKRLADNERAETLSEQEKGELKERIVNRPLDVKHGWLPWFYKMYLVFKYPASYLTIPKELRAGASYLVFPDYKLKDRRPITLLHEP